jgi:hypothetical protein
MLGGRILNPALIHGHGVAPTVSSGSRAGLIRSRYAMAAACKGNPFVQDTVAKSKLMMPSGTEKASRAECSIDRAVVLTATLWERLQVASDLN